MTSFNLEQAARQLLDVAEGMAASIQGISEEHDALALEAITALREALAEQAEQEPVGYWQGTFNQDGGAVLYEVPQASAFGYHYPNHPVYAAPVRTKDLTVSELDAIIEKHYDDEMDLKAMILDGIAADREKNK